MCPLSPFVAFLTYIAHWLLPSKKKKCTHTHTHTKNLYWIFIWQLVFSDLESQVSSLNSQFLKSRMSIYICLNGLSGYSFRPKILKTAKNTVHANIYNTILNGMGNGKRIQKPMQQKFCETNVYNLVFSNKMNKY